MPKFNVLQLMTDSKIGGAERVALCLAKGMNKERFNITVCCLAGKGPIMEEMEKGGIKAYSLGMANKWDFFRALKLISLLKSLNIQILHSHLFHANLLARLIGRLMGVPIIISTEHIMGLEGRWRLFLNRITCGLVDMFIAVSFAVKEFMIKNIGIKSSKITVVQNGIEYEGFQVFDSVKENKISEFAFKQDDKIVGTVARIHKQKGHIYLLSAAKEVVKEVPEAKFLIVGDGPLKNDMEKVSVNLGIAKNVIFTGFYKDIPGILSILDVFVLPSLWEGLPITILEAMAMKKAVIATDVSGNPEVVADNVTGILIPAKNPHSLAQAIIKLIKDEGLRVKMGEAGYNRVRQFFNVNKMVDETAAIYQKLIKEKNVTVT